MTLSFIAIFNKLLLVAIGLIVLGILVFIHELGHFLMAKWCGIRVLAFSLGFGTPLFKKEYRGTEYRISAIPFGGYVKMAGENPEEAKEGADDEFTSKPVWQRALVAVAGPAANFISALLMLWLMFVLGVDRPLYFERPIVGSVNEKSAAEEAGFKAGDSIVTINGRDIKSWDDIFACFTKQDKEYSITYHRDNQQATTVLKTRKPEKSAALPKDPTGGIMPPFPAIVANVSNNSAAEKANIQKGDTIKEINNQEIYSWYQVLDIIKNYNGKDPLTINVARKSGSGIDTISATPTFDSKAKRYLLGIMVDQGEKRIVRYPVSTAFDKSLDKGWEYTVMIFDVIKKMVSQEVSANQLAGPLGIIPMSGGVALQGISPILDFMALIGINLAVLNLLPLVITDGGMLLFLAIEAVRRKPLSLKTQLLLNKIAIAFFLLLFLFVTFNDVQRLPDYFKMFGK